MIIKLFYRLYICNLWVYCEDSSRKKKGKIIKIHSINFICYNIIIDCEKNKSSSNDPFDDSLRHLKMKNICIINVDTLVLIIFNELLNHKDNRMVRIILSKSHKKIQTCNLDK